MSPRHLKSLVEAGHYKPEPELVAEAMLERRGFRAFLVNGLAGPTQLVEAARLQPAAIRRADLDAVAARPPPRPREAAVAGGADRLDRASTRLASDRREQLVVLAARYRQLGAASSPAALATAIDSGRERAAARRRSAGRRRSPRRGGRRRPEAVADVDHRRRPGARQGGALGEPRRGVEQPPAQRLGDGSAISPRAAGAPRRSRPAAAPPSSPVSTRTSSGGGARPGNQVRRARAWPTTVMARLSTGARVTSPPARVTPSSEASPLRPSSISQRVVLVEVLGHAEHAVGLTRPAPHRREVGERGGERPAADLRRATAAAAEVDPVDDRVDRGRGRAAGDGDRGVVAAAQNRPDADAARAGAGAAPPGARTRPFPDCRSL